MRQQQSKVLRHAIRMALNPPVETPSEAVLGYMFVEAAKEGVRLALLDMQRKRAVRT